MQTKLHSNPLMNRFFKGIVVLLITAAFSGKVLAQAPATTCANALLATPIPINTCVTSPTGATGTVNGLAIPACIGTSSTTFKREGWYKFICTTSQNVTFTATTSSATSDLVIQLFTGASCPLTVVACANNITGQSIQTEALSYSCVAGTTYYVRLSNWTASATGTMNLSAFCIYATPPNNDCAGVINLTTSANCIATPGFSLGGTPSAVASCVANQANDDVWYSFTATQTAHTVTVAGLGTYNPVIQVFSGGCGITSVGTCVNLTSGGGTENDVLTNLTAGTVYYVRVYDANPTIPPALVAGANFNICVTTPPLNDNCTGAFNLTSSIGSCNSINATVNGATPSAQPSCGTGTPNNDVWFTFTTPAGVTSQTINVSSVTGSFNPVIEMFSGIYPTLTSLGCYNTSGAGLAESDQFSNYNTGGLTPNTQYYVRVYDYTGATPAANSTFSICAVSPPANDEPCTAISLTPATSCSAGSSAALGDIAGATNTGYANSFVCNNPLANLGAVEDDIWYKFTTSGVAGQPYTITVTPTGSSPTMDAVFEIYTVSSTCPNINFVSLGCVNTNGAGVAESITISPSNFLSYAYNTTYYVRVYDFGISPPTTTSFTICVTLPPINDDCLVQTITNGTSTVNYGPIAITPGCPAAVVAGTVAGATLSMSSTCGTNANDDVWYSFTATQTDETIVVTTSGTFDAAIEAFSAACGGTSLGCTNLVTGSGTERAYLTGLTVGATYWYRIYSIGTGYPSPSSFNTAVISPPVNDNYCDAANLVPSLTCAPTTGVVNCSSPPNPLMGNCTGTATSDVWYTFTANSTSLTVQLTGVGSFNPVLQLFTGSCSLGLTPIAGTCTNATGAGGTEIYTFTGTAIIGQQYYIRVYDFSGATTGSFNICVTNRFPDICAQAITVSCGNTYSGTTTGATSAGDPVAACFGTNTPGTGGVWYVFPGTGTALSASVCGSVTPNTRVAVFTSTTNNCSGTFLCVNGINAVCATDNKAFNIITSVGRNYYIFVYNTGTQHGPFTLAIVCGNPVSNDFCQGAIPVTCGNSYNGSTINATTTNDPTVFCGTSITAPGVWYVFTGNGNTVIADLCYNASYDTRMNVFSTPINNPCPATASLTCVTGNDDNCGLSSQVTFQTTVGQLYYIFVAGFGSNVGTFTLTIQCVAPPANDLCANAIQVTCDPANGGPTYTGSTLLANVDQQPTITPEFCTDINNSPSFNWLTAGVWYWLAGDGNNYTLSLCNGSNYDTEIAVFFPITDNGSPATNCVTNNLGCVAGNDNNPTACSGAGQSIHSSVSFPTVLGTPYYILVHGFGGSRGNYTLNVSSLPACLAFPILPSLSSTAKSLLTIVGHPIGTKNNIQWQSDPEANINYYTIERSEDGTTFTPLAHIEPTTSNTSENNYNTNDNNPVNGWTYYRLVQTDFYQKSTYSTTIAVENTLNNTTVTLDNVHPNPTTNNINFDFYSSISGTLHIQILDYLGRTLEDQTEAITDGNTTITTKMEALAKGIYSLKVSFNQTGFVSVTKIIKN